MRGVCPKEFCVPTWTGAALAALLVLTAAGTARASKPGEAAHATEPPGAGQDPVRADTARTGTKMMIAGWVVLGSLYIGSMVEGLIYYFAASYGAAFESEDKRSSYEKFRDVSTVVPLIGPFFHSSIFLRYKHKSDEDRLFASLLILDGLLQLGALATAVAGYVLLVKDLGSGSGERTAEPRIAARWVIVPSLMRVPGGAGLGLAGGF